ncbi:MAG: hypothetical protein COB67_10310 [SAR324 cluster bacterium]|uniref:Uncharacterized protein n=1 Tax=SAR324 cluster bacterium TaxID=2024889 RepID=A0A2A4SYE1_9DELT|nr:MAG: hypothetical protein COB67_10310 [SAR324 cluster bacterium]
MLLVYLSSIALGYHLLIYRLSKFNKGLIMGIGLMGLYLFILYGFEPNLQYINKWNSKLFTFIPFVSLVAILFPNFNRRNPEIVTIILGWTGLITSLIILVYFKFFYWIA